MSDRQIKPYLIQRLVKSNESVTTSQLKSAFEGLATEHKLEKDQVSALNNFFKLGYMGAAEFEFGAFGRFTRMLARANKASLVLQSIAIEPPKWLTEANTKFDFDSVQASCHIICEERHLETVEDFIWALVENEHDDRWRLKERPQFVDGFYGQYDYMTKKLRKESYSKQIVGWADIDHGWIAFVNLKEAEMLFEALVGNSWISDPNKGTKKMAPAT